MNWSRCRLISFIPYFRPKKSAFYGVFLSKSIFLFSLYQQWQRLYSVSTFTKFTSDIFCRTSSSLLEWWRTDVTYLCCWSAYYSTEGWILVSSKIRNNKWGAHLSLNCYIWTSSQVRKDTNHFDELILIFVIFPPSGLISQASENQEQHLNFSSKNSVVIFIVLSRRRNESILSASNRNHCQHPKCD
jgi:hypothetical protein